MKKNLLPQITITVLLAFPCLGRAQSTSTTDKPVQQAVYFDLLGPGGLYSGNYEFRLSSQIPNSLGLRAGISYFKVSDNSSNVSLLTVPVGVNYLLGKREKYFEVGANATYASAGLNTAFDNTTNSSSGSTVFGTLLFGYRKQADDGGFLFRAGNTILFGNGYFYPFYPYLSFGYSF